MKKIQIIAVSLLFLSLCSFATIYDYSVNTYAGVKHTLQEYQGKKIMVIILPTTQTAEDSAWLHRLDSIGQANASALKIVAVPSLEDGFTSDSAYSLTEWYKSCLDTNIIISEQLFTHKAEGSPQSGLFVWLTHQEQNGHFDSEVAGAGSMYFINEEGSLYGVFGPEARWSDKVLTAMLQQ